MNIFRQHLDNSFKDFLRARVFIHEIEQKETTNDFRRFLQKVLSRKFYEFEQYKIEYSFVREIFNENDASLEEIEFHRFPFGAIFFASVKTIDDLESCLNKFDAFGRFSPRTFVHLFIFVEPKRENVDEDRWSNGNNEFINFLPLQRRDSISSSISVESSCSKTQVELSLSESLPKFYDDDRLVEPSATIVPLSTTPQSKPITTKSRSVSSIPIFDKFESDLTRAMSRLKSLPSKTKIEIAKSNDPELAQIQRKVDERKNCSLIDLTSKDESKFDEIMNEFDENVIRSIFEAYFNAIEYFSSRKDQTKNGKKLAEGKALKRKADCAMLLGAIEKAQQDYQRAVDALKSLNEPLWTGAAIEARIATNFLLSRKSRRTFPRIGSFFTETSLGKKLAVEKLLSKINEPFELQDRFDFALQLYNSSHRSSKNPTAVQLELNASVRWSNFLMQQNDAKKFGEYLIKYMERIDLLGANLEQSLDLIYLNAFLARINSFMGWRRKSALHARFAAATGLLIIAENEKYSYELPFFNSLAKVARHGYGIEDREILFPLIQKTVIYESMQICYKLNDLKTIIENIHFVLENLIHLTTDDELRGLVNYLKNNKQLVSCAYCGIPRLKSVIPLPLPDPLKVWKATKVIFFYHPQRTLPDHHQSICRKLESNLEEKYHVPGQTTRTLTVDCIPIEAGTLKIQGLRYNLWSTEQDFQFADYPILQQCSCMVDVVDQLPLLDIQSLQINGQMFNPNEANSLRIYRGETVYATINVKNLSQDLKIDYLEIDALLDGLHVKEWMSVDAFDLPLIPGENRDIKINISGLYDRFFYRQDVIMSNTKNLKVELHVLYSNEKLQANYNRRQTVEFQLEYIPSTVLDILDVENDEDESFYLIRCKVENLLEEDIFVENQTTPAQQSAINLIKQRKIQLDKFTSSLQQCLTVIRDKLPKQIHYQTRQSGKQLCLTMNWERFSGEKLQNRIENLIQTPFQCHWHFQQANKILTIYLCVETKSCFLTRLEFQFLSSGDYRFLNSNKISFDNLNPNQYITVQRTVSVTTDHDIDLLQADIRLNDFHWKRITLTL